MKLLLTSAGLSNPTICKALNDLVGKTPAKTCVAFIPTAVNVEPGDKTTTIMNLDRIKNYGAGVIDIVDISALPRALWQPRLEAADVLFFAGGNPYHLMDCLISSGLGKLLPKLLESRILLGQSAGSAVTGPSLAYSTPKAYMPPTLHRDKPAPALGLVNFCVRTHYNSRHSPHVTEASIRQQAAHFRLPVYAIDDYSAIRVIDEDVDVVTEGTYLKLD